MTEYVILSISGKFLDLFFFCLFIDIIICQFVDFLIGLIVLKQTFISIIYLVNVDFNFNRILDFSSSQIELSLLIVQAIIICI